MSKDKSGNWFMRHKLLTAVLVIVVIAIAVNLGGGDTPSSNDDTSQTNNETSSETEQTETAKIGTAVRDGKFEFTVGSFSCGETTLGENEFLREEAQGHFCVMELTVKNIGDEAQTFFSSDQKILNAAGQEYSNDTSAELAINDSDVWLNEVNPGNTATGKVVFDVPIDADITTAELHDSAFSGGVKVDLK